MFKEFENIDKDIILGIIKEKREEAISALKICPTMEDVYRLQGTIEALEYILNTPQRFEEERHIESLKSDDLA